MRLILLNKPFRVLPQFTSPDQRRCLKELVSAPGLYPAGRLDYDSEGLLVLTDFGPWQARISQPGAPFPKVYLVQVEGVPDESALECLRRGVRLNDGATLPAPARLVPEPVVALAARPADPGTQGDTDGLDGTRASRGQEPAGPPHDRGRGSPDAQADSSGRRAVVDRGLAPGQSREVPREEAERLLAAGRVRSSARSPRSASRARGPARS